MNRVVTSISEQSSRVLPHCIGGFADDVKNWKDLPDPGNIFAIDARSRSALCLPLDRDCSAYVASVAFPSPVAYQPDSELVARTYGRLVTLALEAGCGRLALVPPAATDFVLPCLIEALVRRDLAGGAEILDLNLAAFPARLIRQAELVVQGKSLSRQITETTPELPVSGLAELAAHGMATAGANVVTVATEALSREYPLLCAVASATSAVPERRPSVLRVQLGDPAAPRAVFCAGKGVVMDTGGVDLKPAGQYGMSRDKGGAGSLAGFVAAAASAMPDDLFIQAELAFTWNGIGGGAITPDHCLTSAGGVRVQVGNTDAEGRLLLSDLVASLLSSREKARARSAEFIALATLTGHAGRSFGKRSVLVGDDMSQQRKLDRGLYEAATRMGERAAVSPLCAEDWEVMRTAKPGIDLVAGTPANSIATPRGHQYPCAVIKTLSGWFSKPRPDADCFLLADIAGANTRSDVPGMRAAAPMVGALADRYLFSEGQIS